MSDKNYTKAFYLTVIEGIFTIVGGYLLPNNLFFICFFTGLGASIALLSWNLFKDKETIDVDFTKKSLVVNRDFWENVFIACFLGIGIISSILTTYFIVQKYKSDFDSNFLIIWTYILLISIGGFSGYGLAIWIEGIIFDVWFPTKESSLGYMHKYSAIWIIPFIILAIILEYYFISIGYPISVVFYIGYCTLAFSLISIDSFSEYE